MGFILYYKLFGPFSKSFFSTNFIEKYSKSFNMFNVRYNKTNLVF